MNKNEIVNIQIKFLKFAMWFSIFLAALGGCLYLNKYGVYLPNDLLIGSKKYVPSFELKFVKIALYLLIFIQMIRIVFIIGIFYLKKDFLFIGMSLFIFFTLIFSLFGHYFLS